MEPLPQQRGNKCVLLFAAIRRCLTGVSTHLSILILIPFVVIFFFNSMEPTLKVGTNIYCGSYHIKRKQINVLTAVDRLKNKREIFLFSLNLLTDIKE